MLGNVTCPLLSLQVIILPLKLIILLFFLTFICPFHAGQGNSKSEAKMPHAYCVLDTFHVTDVWPEIISQCGKEVIQWMYRLEKIDLLSDSWWTPEGKEAENFKPGEVYSGIWECNSCSSVSKQIFRQSWTCLKHTCSQYFQFPFAINVDDLTYDEKFLKERTAFENFLYNAETGEIRAGRTPPKLCPDLPPAPNGQTTFGTEDLYFRGIVCRKCGSCITRLYWGH